MTKHALHPADIDPSEDGKTHLRICHRARTPLGRWLAECARAPMVGIAVPGADEKTFASISAVRLWLITQDPVHALAWGPPALKFISQLKIQKTLTQEVYEDLLRKKLEQNPQLCDLLMDCGQDQFIVYSTLEDDPDVVGEYEVLEPWKLRILSEFAKFPIHQG